MGLIGLAGEDKHLDYDSVLSEQSMQATPYSTTEIELPVFNYMKGSLAPSLLVLDWNGL